MYYKGIKHKQIGKGTFTTAYLSPNEKIVLLRSSDPMKQALAEGFYVDCYLFPKAKLVDDGLYEMEYYPSQRGIIKHLGSKRQIELYRWLRKAFEESLYTRCNKYSYWWKKFSSMPAKFEREKEYLLYTLSDLSNWTSNINFEFQPRNLRVVKGKLLLLDCFLCINKLQEENRKASERRNLRYYR